MNPMWRLAVVVCLSLAGTLRGQSVETRFAFVGVSVIPMNTERVVPAQTVVTQGDRVVAIGPEASTGIPADATRIDGRNKFLLPGLADMHGYIPPSSETRGYVESVLFLFLSNGVTTVRAVADAPGQLALRAQANRGEILSPTLYLAGPGFETDGSNTPEDAVAHVRQEMSDGWDFLEILPGLTPQDYTAMIQTAREVGMPFGGHVPNRVPLNSALDARQPVIYLEEYLYEQDREPFELRLANAVVRTREARVAIIPAVHTMNVVSNDSLSARTLSGFPELKFMPPRLVQQWRRDVGWRNSLGSR